MKDNTREKKIPGSKKNNRKRPHSAESLLGKGFKSATNSHTPYTALERKGVPRVPFETIEIRSMVVNSLDKTSTGLDLGLAADIGIPSVSASIHAEAKAVFKDTHTESTSYAILTVYKTSEKSTLSSDTRLSQTASDNLSQNNAPLSQQNINSFYSFYGDKCISTVFYGNKITIIFQFQAESKERTKELLTDLHAQVLNQTAGAKIDYTSETMTKFSKVKVFVSSVGDNSSSQPASSKELNATLNQHLQKKSNTPISYELTDYTNIKPHSNNTAENRKEILENLNELRKKVKIILKQTQRYLRKIERSELRADDNVVRLNKFENRQKDPLYETYVKLRKQAKEHESNLKEIYQEIAGENQTPTKDRMREIFLTLAGFKQWYDDNKTDIKAVAKCAYVGELTIPSGKKSSESLPLQKLYSVRAKTTALFFKIGESDEKKFRVSGKRLHYFLDANDAAGKNSHLYPMNDLEKNYANVKVDLEEKTSQEEKVRVYATSLDSLSTMQTLFNPKRDDNSSCLTDESPAKKQRIQPSTK